MSARDDLAAIIDEHAYGPDGLALSAADAIIAAGWTPPAAVVVEPSADGLDCDGSGTCASALHQHGCFADQGNCTDPDDHATKPVEPSAAEVLATEPIGDANSLGPCTSICDAASYGVGPRTGCFTPWCKCECHRRAYAARSLAARTVAPETEGQ